MLTWRFQVASEALHFGLITGVEPVPAGWGDGEAARAYEIWNQSSGWVNCARTDARGI